MGFAHFAVNGVASHTRTWADHSKAHLVLLVAEDTAVVVGDYSVTDDDIVMLQ